MMELDLNTASTLDIINHPDRDLRRLCAMVSWVLLVQGTRN